MTINTLTDIFNIDDETGRLKITAPEGVATFQGERHRDELCFRDANGKVFLREYHPSRKPTADEKLKLDKMLTSFRAELERLLNSMRNG